MSQQSRFKHKFDEQRTSQSSSNDHFFNDREAKPLRRAPLGKSPRKQFSRDGVDNDFSERRRKPFSRDVKEYNGKSSQSSSYGSARPEFSSRALDSNPSYGDSHTKSRSYERYGSRGHADSSVRKDEGSRTFSHGESRRSSYGDSRGSSFGNNRWGKPSFRGGAQSKPKRVFQKFNPSMFIKKVTEQVATPPYTAKHTFQDFPIAEQIKHNIASKGYVTPTPIQDQVIPLILAGNDVIGTANTGTGKTASFLIPLIDNVVNKRVSRVLIVTATRELALQIKSELDSFKLKMPLASAICIGGCNIYMQIQSLKRDPAFVICTPGRLRDLESNNHIQLSRYDAIVLDEVDTMLDIGFINDITYVVGKLPAKRQSLFFSATITEKLRPIMNSFLKNPITVSVKTRESAENVNQDVIKVTKENKIDVLHDLLVKPEFTRVIIFSRTKHSTDKLAETLQERGFSVATIHGNKSQSQRQRALAQFKNVYNKINILLATDLMARGIDINDVSHVINYDMPETYEDYIHKIGRTGRGNKVGNAITFVD